ncbi:MAG TPA: hypothetical protein VE954_02165 [Oligoflexus sp.]|uniref:linalool dehydratase/isomerase domain-containing protein n=1 Tax=Oligoflexus sp. TaxID=1971216 RepID=UPI002D665F48|nr:hypothetical protein [Oligoflexus sp.]HYX31891.1 hypothetical protein [Oligoflexus sp.]
MKAKRFLKLVAGLVLIGLGLVLALAFRMHSFPQTGAYFEKPGVRKLQKDEVGQWHYIRHLYTELEATGEQFKGWDESQQDMWKYAIAFLAYSMPSMAIIKPEDKPLAEYFLSVMIHKMKAKKVWEDWQRYGFGDDPICKDNIMYKGHLNLMYGLYQLMTGSDRYASEFTWLTQKIVEEIEESKQGKFRGVVCEPDRYFVQCNAIGLLSLEIYDRIYGTPYAKYYGEDVMKFIRERLIDPETGLYHEAYHPSHDITIPYLSGYTNAWTMVMLRPFDKEYQAKIYPKWKDLFVREYGPFAVVRESRYGGPSRLATLFGMLAAKEFGDRELFGKLRNTIDLGGFLHKDTERGYLSYGLADNTLLNGMVFSFKMHVGWQKILDHNWPQPEAVPTVPEISLLDSFDVLDTRKL